MSTTGTLCVSTTASCSPLGSVAVCTAGSLSAGGAGSAGGLVRSTAWAGRGTAGPAVRSAAQLPASPSWVHHLLDGELRLPLRHHAQDHAMGVAQVAPRRLLHLRRRHLAVAIQILLE